MQTINFNLYQAYSCETILKFLNVFQNHYFLCFVTGYVLLQLLPQQAKQNNPKTVSHISMDVE